MSRIRDTAPEGDGASPDSAPLEDVLDIGEVVVGGRLRGGRGLARLRPGRLGRDLRPGLGLPFSKTAPKTSGVPEAVPNWPTILEFSTWAAVT